MIIIKVGSVIWLVATTRIIIFIIAIIMVLIVITLVVFIE